MAGTSLLALLDDIATALDDVAIMTKTATKKTAAVLGDDLALNAQQVIGIHANRELPVVWAVAKGSVINKLILIPLALLINFFLPMLVNILLMLGGLYLCFEGFEKISEKIFHKTNHSEKITEIPVDMLKFEQDRIQGAVRTDFVLSAEIIVITLGIVAQTPLVNQLLVLTLISLIMTVGVYGLVACIVKLDDLGFLLREKKAPLKQLGFILISAAPALMKILAIVGTAAMFLVGGGIIRHGIPFLHYYTESMSSVQALGMDLLIGIIAGALAVLIYLIVNKIKARIKRVWNRFSNY